MPDYIPAPDAAANSWMQNFAIVIAADPGIYNLNAADATDISNAADAFDTALTVATDPATRTAPSVAAKDSARAAAEAVLRPYAVTISRSGGITDMQKADVGVTIRKEVPTPIPTPAIAPEIGLVNAIIGQQTISIKNPSSAGKEKPFGVVAVEFRRTIGEAVAVDPNVALPLGLHTKSPTVLTSAPADAGRVATIWARYVTRSGPSGIAQTGPWSASLSFNLL